MDKTLDLNFLENLHRRYHRLENLSPDPLIFARGYEDPEDGEVAGIISSALAYGRVEQIVLALGQVFAKLGKRPRRTLMQATHQQLDAMFEGFCYRFNKGPDLAAFLWLLKNALERGKSLRAIFATLDGGDYRGALSSFGEYIMEGDPRPLIPSSRLPQGHPTRYLLTTPSGGSAAKRLCLFMRWMNRSDELDPGYWGGLVNPARLVVPLDTHVAKVGRAMGMTSRKSADWKAAEEITEHIRRFYPNDPLKADFSLFRFGMKRLDNRE